MTNKTSEFLEETLFNLQKSELEKAETQEEKNQINKKFKELDTHKIFSALYTQMTLKTTNNKCN